ncbi:MAG TPA: four helix bundle protein [Bacteroidota bacterium]|nr:four helix bundle protein [Bacteroidota bacterium]
MRRSVKSHYDLEVFQISFETATKIFEITRKFPSEERYSLTDQIRRSSRSVSANIAEAFRKRRYALSFIAKLSDAAGEAAETQVWLDFSAKCRYITEDAAQEMKTEYDRVIGKLVIMINRPEDWDPSRRSP